MADEIKTVTSFRKKINDSSAKCLITMAFCDVDESKGCDDCNVCRRYFHKEIIGE